MNDKLVYKCDICNYKCLKKYDFNRHLNTKKHSDKKKIIENRLTNNINTINLTNSTNSTNITNITNTINKINNRTIEFICNCGKEYRHRQSLYAHKKKCKYINDNSINEILTTDNDNDFKNLVLNLIKENNTIRDTLVDENRELRKQLTEIIPKIGDVNSNNTIKQKFNIQFFLNNHCKDAINLDDFVKSIEISVKQLDITHNRGLIDGLSEAIIQNMSKLGTFERPMHCTDIKRETLYIKDNDVWEKDYDKTKIKHAIKSISTKQYSALKTWMDVNPDFRDIDVKQDYFATTLSTIGKSTDTENIDEKIIKKICSNIYIKE